MDSDDLLITQQRLAERLGKSTKTLEAWRAQSVGPAYVRVGRSVRYRESDVERWLAAQTVGTRSLNVTANTATQKPGRHIYAALTALHYYAEAQRDDRGSYAWIALSAPYSRHSATRLAFAADANYRDAAADRRDLAARYAPA